MRHIVYTNLIVSLSAGILSGGFSRFCGISNWYWYGVFAATATLAVYNGQRLCKAGLGLSTPWLTWVHTWRKALTALVVVSMLSAGAALWMIDRLSDDALILLGCSGGISLFYVLKIGGRNLRDIPYLKIHLIVLCWIAILILFPQVNEGRYVQSLGVSVAHYCYLLAVAIPFDIRDLRYDVRGQRTIPQVIGSRSAKWLAAFLMVVFAGIMFNLFPVLIKNGWFYAAVVVQLILILGMNEQRGDLYCAGGVDGAISLLGISYLMAG